MKLKFLKAKYDIEFEIPKDFIKTLKSKVPQGTLAIYSAIQFLPNIKEVKELLEQEGYKIITSKPDRASFEGQILGCDSYADNLKINLDDVDGFIYIGDGYFHPSALLLAQENQDKIKPVIILNAPQKKIEIIEKDYIEKYFKKRKGNLLKFHTSQIIGVFVSSKWGQEYKTSALKIKDKYPQKEFYYFAGDNFLDSEMENYPFIECWINTACPRIGQDDVTRHPKAVVNIKDIS